MVKIKNGEIFVYGEIRENQDVELIDALSQFRGKPVVLRINSPGGLVDTALSMFYALKRHSGKVTTIVDSLAASAGSLIALGGSVRLTEPSARWMIHCSTISNISGNARDLTYAVELLREYDETMAEIYREHLKPGTDVMALMERETYFNARRAVEVGLSTGIVGAGTQTPVALTGSRDPRLVRLRLTMAAA